jgi:beta-lactamase regulating signal transducer with metallopeptidase domain
MNALVEAGLSNVLASAALAVVAIAVGLVCRRPAVSRALWLLVLLKLVTPPLFRVPVPWPAPASPARVAQADAPPAPTPEPAPPEGPEAGEADGPDEGELVLGEPRQLEEPPEPAAPAAVAPAPPATAPAAPGAGWQSLLGVAWLTGSAVWFALALRRAWRFTRAVRQARPAPARLQGRVEELARQMGLSRAPQVRLVPGRLPPLIWAVGRPCLLLPEALPARVGEQGLDTLLAHELAHLARRDHWVRWLEMVVLGLFWWDPLAWYARQQLREAEEQCCDALVVTALPGYRRAYASAIVDALDFLSKADPPPQLASGVGQVADLKRRLTMIMRETPSPRLGLLSGLAVFALTGLLPLMPGRAAAQEGTKEDVVVIKQQLADVLKVQGADDDEKKLAAELARKAQEMAALKEKIAAVAAAKKARDAAKLALTRGGAAGSMTVRVEVSGLSKEEANALAEALQKALPKGKDKKVILSIDGKGTTAFGGGKALFTEKAKAGQFKFEFAPHGKGATTIKSGDGKGTVTIRYIDSATGKVIKEEVVTSDKGTSKAGEPKKTAFGPDVKRGPLFGGGAPKAAGDRIDRLEKQLEALMKELSELRKEMGGRGHGLKGRVAPQGK